MSVQLVEEVRSIALALPEVTEGFSHGAPAFYVRKRALCYFHDAEFGSDGRIALWWFTPPIGWG